MAFIEAKEIFILLREVWLLAPDSGLTSFILEKNEA